MIDSSNVGATIAYANDLARSGAWDEAIRLLTESNRQEENAAVEARLVKLRHLAFTELYEPVLAGPWPNAVPDHFPGVASIPEITASELSCELVASAIQHHGSILVRGLLDQNTVEAIRESIDEAFAGAAVAAENPSFEPSAWYNHFTPNRKKGYRFGGMERHFANFGGGVLAVDSPRALFRYLEALSALGFDKLLYEYFGERPALSAKKSTLRRAPPTTTTTWHQDGAYFGAQSRSLNIWAAFSPCGVDAPSLDIFAKRFDTLVKGGGPGIADTAVSIETAASCGEEFIVRPVFEPGDAVLFDQMTLHRTGVDDSMTKSRYAVELWFFATSTFPLSEIPLQL